MTQLNQNQITLTRPDDWHLHLRDDLALERTVGDTAKTFGRAIVMPNLRPPVISTALALDYKSRIVKNIPADSQFQPLMTLYLTDNTSADEIYRAKESGVVHAVKLYPAGATTNSDAGVTDLKHCYKALDAMQKIGMPLLVHGEVTSADIDVFDREKVFLETILGEVVADFPKLKIVLEHITTKDAVDFVTAAPQNVAATITAHHLLYNRNHMLAGGIRPHYYCLPILKRNIHQQALMAAAISGNKKFFLGTDSAPHYKDKKEAVCGCAGAYTAHAAIELYAEAFEEAGELDKLEGFASHFGPDFYGLARNTDTITLEKSPWQVPASYTLGDSQVVPIKAEATIDWQVK